MAYTNVCVRIVFLVVGQTDNEMKNDLIKINKNKRNKEKREGRKGRREEKED